MVAAVSCIMNLNIKHHLMRVNMADDKKKKKEVSLLDIVKDKYESAAQQGYLGSKAKVATEEKKKKRMGD
jgi:hypothetical protein